MRNALALGSAPGRLRRDRASPSSAPESQPQQSHFSRVDPKVTTSADSAPRDTRNGSHLKNESHVQILDGGVVNGKSVEAFVPVRRALENGVRINVTDAEIAEALAPSIGRVLHSRDKDWRRLKRRLLLKWRTRRYRRLLSFWRQGTSEKELNYKYEGKWTPTRAFKRIDVSRDQHTPIIWGDRCYLANTAGTKRVHLLYLMDLIAQLHPRSVLEVGSGTGQNLFVLSAQFPGIAFTGLELTAAGVKTARAIASCAKLPDELARFSPRPIRDDTAHRHVEFVEGSGSSLPFPDGSFDLVYTVLALEQMERVREDALREIARVSAGAAAMIEPFRDWNASGIARNRVVAKGYFSARLSDLRSLGLEPLFTDSSLPRKLDFGVGIVVARAN